MIERSVFLRYLRRLRDDTRGASIIELALIAPVLALLAVGMIDMSNAYNRKLSLQQGAQRAIERTTQDAQDETVQESLQAEVMCQVNGTKPDGSCKDSPVTKSDVTVAQRTECVNGAGVMDVKSDPSENCAANDAESRFISVTVRDRYKPMLPIHFSGLDKDGTYHLVATAGQRIR